MAKTETVKALARVLIGLAWADGKVTDAELRLLKDVMFRIPDLTADDWDDLEIYWMTPIHKTEMQILTEEFLQTLQTDDDKEYARKLLLDMAHVDGELTEREKGILRSLKRSFENVDTAMVDEMGQLIEGMLQKRAARMKNSDYLQDFVKNRVYHLMRERFGEQLEAQLDLDETEIRKLALAGALMGRVAYADENISAEETTAIHRILQRDWNLRDTHATIVTDCAVQAVEQQLDLYRLARELYETTIPQERLDFVDVLFDVARSADGIAKEEKQEIHSITRALKLTEDDYQAARDRAQFMATLW